MEFWQGVLMVSSQKSVAGMAAMESVRRGSREVVGQVAGRWLWLVLWLVLWP